MTLEMLEAEIRTLSKDERKQLVGFIIDTFTEPEESLASQKRDILEFEGVGAEMWGGIDAQKYVDQLRSDWD